MIVESASYEETIAVGKQIASRLNPGDIVALEGGLGAGKTALTAGIAAFFGFTEGIASPTFTIINPYETPTLTLYHVDVYRLERAEELLDIGLDDMLYDGGGITVIEWADKIKEFLPEDVIRIFISRDDKKGENYRKLTIDWGRDR